MTSITFAAAPSLHLPAGRWRVDGMRSHLGVSVRVGGLATVRGRFTDVAGHLDVTDRPEDTTVLAEIATGSLTSGSSYWDRVLAAAGLVDATTHPVLRYRSTALRPGRVAGTWALQGVLTPGAGLGPLTFDLAGPSPVAPGRAAFRARGALPSAVAAALLARGDAQCLLGPTMSLDLRIEVLAPSA